MRNDLLTGELVRLAAADPEQLTELYSRWSRDSEFWRYLDANAVRPYSTQELKKWFEKETNPERFTDIYLVIRSKADDRLIGDIGLDGIQWNQGASFVGIGIGEREFWGKGYGSDAMRVLLRYAFTELNLRRISLGVFEYNQRAVRSYEKVGFVHEGRERQFLNRDGRRWDLIFMGITREEWLNQAGAGV